MNISILTADGKILCRPDTTWERDDKDLFVPDGMSGFLYAPILFARVSKAGKFIGEKYADRYYDSINFGILLYPEDDLDGTPASIGAASCHDRTSVLPFPLYTKHTLEKQDNEFVLLKDCREIYRKAVGTDSMALIENALVRISSAVSQRIGDYVAVELEPMKGLVCSKEKETHISASYCENPVFDFKIIF